jgi:hypothetical protein
MRDVAQMAHKMGWPLPKPLDPLDLLAKQFADAAGEETREDKVTKKPYKANLAFYRRRRSDGKQLWLWFDVDDATRPQMTKGVKLYRETLVSGAVIGVNTVELAPFQSALALRRWIALRFTHRILSFADGNVEYLLGKLDGIAGTFRHELSIAQPAPAILGYEISN